MIGIILAGGQGSRLYPMTKSTSKQLLPVYDKPMIYYPITTLMFAGVKDFVVIVTPEHLSLYEQLLSDGSQWGVRFIFVVQPQATGIADCLNLVPAELKSESCVLILGDNIFYGMGLGSSLKSHIGRKGALAFAYEVSNPNDYGVVVLDSNKKPTKLLEKPSEFVSKFAIPGLYWFDSKCFDFARNLTPSARGELEIIDVLQNYLDINELSIEILPRGTAWLDTGTPKDLLAASNFVHVIEERQGLKIGCPEEVAFREGLINGHQLEDLRRKMPASNYRKYLDEMIVS
jgi:glucose-1-phosphate thymidylyltransferase